jgi:hypothetical protein
MPESDHPPSPFTRLVQGQALPNCLQRDKSPRLRESGQAQSSARPSGLPILQPQMARQTTQGWKSEYTGGKSQTPGITECWSSVSRPAIFPGAGTHCDNSYKSKAWEQIMACVSANAPWAAGLLVRTITTSINCGDCSKSMRAGGGSDVK